MVTLEAFLLSSHDRTQITAQLTQAVYVSPSGKYLLIRQDAKLIGNDDSSVAFGQSRILLGPASSCPAATRLCWNDNPAPAAAAAELARERA
ncbi:hypothetical protein ABIB90_007277 [Bradyrhizobium sp. JR4.1]